jgi:hypothetical protein
LPCRRLIHRVLSPRHEHWTVDNTDISERQVVGAVVIADTAKSPPFQSNGRRPAGAICVPVRRSLEYYLSSERKKNKQRKLGRSFQQRVVVGGGGLSAGSCVRGALDLEKVVVSPDGLAVRCPVAGAWTVAIVPFRSVTPRPRPQTHRPAWVRARK